MLRRRLLDAGITEGLACLLNVRLAIGLDIAIAGGERRTFTLRYAQVLVRRLAALVVLHQGQVRSLLRVLRDPGLL